MTDLLLLPGLMCDRAIWAPVLPWLEPLARVSVAAYADCDSITTMAERALSGAPERFALAGHSMGGRVALEILRRAPQRVERVALLDTGFQARAAGEAGEAERKQRLSLLDLARREGMRAMGAVWLIGMVPPQRLADRALIDAIADMVARHSADQFEAQITALLGRPDATDLLSAIACPTLIACGRLDAWSPLSRHEEMARRVPASRLAVFEDCGHMAPMEAPDIVGSALARWLA